MPYAADMQVSYKEITGGTPISDDEYNQGRDHLINGGMVKVHGGKMILTSKPEKLDGHLEPVWQDGDWYHEPEPEPTQAEIDAEKAKSEHAWVKSELDFVDEQLRYHWTDDRDRKAHTEQAWKDYAIALRDYTTTDADGNPQVVGESRPSIEDFIEVK